MPRQGGERERAAEEEGGAVRRCGATSASAAARRASRALVAGLWLAASASVVAAGCARAEAPLPPAPVAHLTDGAGFLSARARDELDARLADVERRSGHQIVVWIGRSTGGVPLEEWAARTFAAWRVGRAGLDDGVVLFVLADDRALRVEVGYGLEGRLPDALASRIVRAMSARLAAGDRDGAVRGGVDGILAAVEGASAAAPTGAGAPAVAPTGDGAQEPQAEPAPPDWRQIAALAALAVLFLILIARHPWLLLFLMGRGGWGGGRRNGGGGWGGGGGFGGGGGGGGFSGGGGSSGGGGASGRW